MNLDTTLKRPRGRRPTLKRLFPLVVALATSPCMLSPVMSAEIPKKGSVIVCVGDSITENPSGYVPIVRMLLRDFHADLGLRVVNAGVSSDDLQRVLARLDSDVLVHKPDIIFAYIGVNDVASGTTREQYESRIRELVKRCKGCGARTILCTPAVRGENLDDSNKLNPMLDDFSELSLQAAKDAGIESINLRALCLKILKKENTANKDRGFVTYDGLHLNFRGNCLLAERVLRTIGFDQPDSAALVAEWPKLEQEFTVRFAARGPVDAAAHKDAIRVACVGDSITFGMNIPGRETNCYPAQLQALLGHKWEVRNFGVSGRTMLKNPVHPYCATYWKEKAFTDATDYNPDVVVLKLGTNDFSLDENWALRHDFVLDYLAMLDHFAALAAKPRIFLVYPAPLFDDKKPFISANLAQIRTLIRQIAEERNLPVIDLDPLMGAHPELFLDGCHPNATGAGIIAREVFKALTGKPAPAR